MPRKYKFDNMKLKYLLKTKFLLEIDKVYHEEDLLTFFGFNPNDKLVDHIVHERTCYYIIIEETSTHFKKALQQAEYVAKKLQEKGMRVKNVILIGKTFKRENIFTVKNRILYKKIGNIKKPFEISTGNNKIRVLFYRINEVM